MSPRFSTSEHISSLYKSISCYNWQFLLDFSKSRSSHQPSNPSRTIKRREKTPTLPKFNIEPEDGTLGDSFLQTIIFRFHVKLWEGNSNNGWMDPRRLFGNTLPINKFCAANGCRYNEWYFWLIWKHMFKQKNIKTPHPFYFYFTVFCGLLGGCLFWRVCCFCWEKGRW